jgi:DNA polymerase III subunit epsilon
MMSVLDWFSRRPTTPQLTHERWVVVDVETSGLDPHTAQLLAIAAVAVQVDWTTRKLSIVPGDSFEVDIRPETVVKDKGNILVHGIGQNRQLQGESLNDALNGFIGYIGGAKLLAFHAWFDKALIGRHVQMAMLPGMHKGLPNPWVDIEKLCVASHPHIKAHSLDEWMDEFGITCAARHEAAADTFAECEVLQRIWPRLAAQSTGWPDILRLEKEGRWLTRNS